MHFRNKSVWPLTVQEEIPHTAEHRQDHFWSQNTSEESSQLQITDNWIGLLYYLYLSVLWPKNNSNQQNKLYEGKKMHDNEAGRVAEWEGGRIAEWHAVGVLGQHWLQKTASSSSSSYRAGLLSARPRKPQKFSQNYHSVRTETFGLISLWYLKLWKQNIAPEGGIIVYSKLLRYLSRLTAM